MSLENGGRVDIIVYMPDSGLPRASLSPRSVRIGNIEIKAEKPTQSFAEAKRGLDNLEVAAKGKVFAQNEPSE